MTPFQAVDALFIMPFRVLSNPEAGFYFGICVLALASAALGRACSLLVGWVQRKRRAQEDGGAQHRSELSFQALQMQDKEAYLAQNHLAQEHYGNSLALSAGRGAALLWPGIIALAWLSIRFEGVPAPYLWASAGPVTVFFPPYILALLAFSRINPSPSNPYAA
ncbi:MAG: hypothetical protein CVU73_03130 [Deltaproteobacteria bacterium HGW-Deltaproteobacteria-8]|jgi:hypothetical protein|nr:MAG: hypothetical protein CVU73_03130 [Deltaproteobacteria bacterium HGW-Deltaproteobacteria-8]